MKKTVLLLLMLFSFYANAQKLVLTPTGFKDSANVEKDYIVLNIEKKTAKELYDSVVKYINLNYKNPKEVIKGSVESDFIKFETYVPDFPLVKSLGVNMDMGTRYTTILSFQDNKIKYEITNLIIKNIQGAAVNVSGSAMSGISIFNKAGDIKRNDVKIQLENYFNENIESIIKSISNENKAKKDW